jgi:hypothetical protein
MKNQKINTIIKYVSLSFLLIFVSYKGSSQVSPIGYLLDETKLALASPTTTITDMTAYNGTALYRSANSGGGTLWYGPYLHFQGGNYLIQFRLKVSSNATSSNLFSIDVVSNYGATVYASLNINPAMFRNSNEWELITIPAELPDNIGNCEIRGLNYQAGIADVYLDYINIIPGDIRNIYSNEIAITGNGNVGIGTITPGAKLDVSGGIRIAEGNSIGVSPYNHNRGHDNAVSFGQEQGNISSVNYNDGNYNNQYLTFSTHHGGVGMGERMRIDRDGNVGIGTTSPTEKLSVNGNIRSKKIIVTQNGWSDYVFNDGYHLRPLTQVENFIKENKHLPEVPTAKEVEKNGVDVGETQALLLKKIEELTLYMIEMKKENDNLKNRIIKLEQDAKKP